MHCSEHLYNSPLLRPRPLGAVHASLGCTRGSSTRTIQYKTAQNTVASTPWIGLVPARRSKAQLCYPCLPNSVQYELSLCAKLSPAHSCMLGALKSDPIKRLFATYTSSANKSYFRTKLAMATNGLAWSCFQPYIHHALNPCRYIISSVALLYALLHDLLCTE